MDNDAQKIIEEQIKNLPADVKSAITSVDYVTKLQEITKRQRLLIDQAGKFEMETTLVMIGLEPLADYIGNLQRELGIEGVRAQTIAADVSESIFKPIRQSLRAMNESVESEEEVRAQAQNIAKQSQISTPIIEPNLNRAQILNEIENPHIIGKDISPATPVSTSTAIEIKPAQEITTISGQGIKTEPSLMESKMSDITITTRQVVNAKPEVKLPEVKKRPSSGVDPYREPIN